MFYKYKGMKVWAYKYMSRTENTIYGDETGINTMEERTKGKCCQHDTWQPKVRSHTRCWKFETVKSLQKNIQMLQTLQTMLFYHYVN